MAQKKNHTGAVIKAALANVEYDLVKTAITEKMNAIMKTVENELTTYVDSKEFAIRIRKEVIRTIDEYLGEGLEDLVGSTNFGKILDKIGDKITASISIK